ncbi:MAG: phosphoribosyl transferase [Cyanobacteria bacterium PR.3.49]|nr:phosphoribosyl transferase [Cyanobacteria bacterium PR.3.49]
MFFRDRRDAGRRLAMKLAGYRGSKHILVLALPRGGVPVAYEIARSLNAFLDCFIVRKIGAPGNNELAVGAIASGGTRILNDKLITELDIPRTVIDKITQIEAQELDRREELYRRGREYLRIENKTVILVDDGLATGASMTAAVQAIKNQRPKKLIVAVPVASPETLTELGRKVDQTVCLQTPNPFWSVGSWYADFTQTSDQEVQFLLDDAARNWAAA